MRPLTHVLKNGYALCGRKGIPGTWASSERWISYSEWSIEKSRFCNDLCPGCDAHMKENIEEEELTEKIELIADLERGDIVRHKLSKRSYVVNSSYGSYAIGLTSVHISNPDEWERVVKSDE